MLYLIGIVFWLWILGAWLIHDAHTVINDEEILANYVDREMKSNLTKTVYLLFWPILGTLILFRRKNG